MRRWRARLALAAGLALCVVTIQAPWQGPVIGFQLSGADLQVASNLNLTGSSMSAFTVGSNIATATIDWSGDAAHINLSPKRLKNTGVTDGGRVVVDDYVRLLPQATPTSFGEGDLFTATTTKTFVAVHAAGNVSLGGPIYVMPSDGVTMSNTTSRTDLDPGYTFPASSIVAGQLLRTTMTGRYSTGPTAVSITLHMMIGGKVLAATPTLVAATSSTDRPWTLKCWMTLRAGGSSGKAVAMIEARVKTSTSNFSDDINRSDSANAPAIVIDWTVPQRLTMAATWTASSPSNTFTAEQFVIEKVQ